MSYKSAKITFFNFFEKNLNFFEHRRTKCLCTCFLKKWKTLIFWSILLKFSKFSDLDNFLSSTWEFRGGQISCHIAIRRPAGENYVYKISPLFVVLLHLYLIRQTKLGTDFPKAWIAIIGLTIGFDRLYLHRYLLDFKKNWCFGELRPSSRGLCCF